MHVFCFSIGTRLLQDSRQILKPLSCRFIFCVIRQESPCTSIDELLEIDAVEVDWVFGSLLPLEELMDVLKGSWQAVFTVN